MKNLLSAVLLSLLVCACGSGSKGPTGSTAGSGAGAGSGAAGSSGSGTGSGTGSTSSGTPNPIGLWLGGEQSYDAASLAASGMPQPNDTCNGLSPGIPNAGPTVFDGRGNLWTVQEDSNENEDIVEWSAAQLAAGCPTSTPAIQLIDMTPESDLSSLAFDSQGNLWAANNEEQEILGYKASDLAASGNIMATWQIQPSTGGTVNTIYAPLGLAFDSAGYLWVGNYFSVMAFSPQTLAAALYASAGNSPPGDAYLSNAAAIAYEAQPGSGGMVGYAEYQYNYLAFDASGNLWVSVYNGLATPKGDVIVEFAKSDLGALAANHAPAPIVTLTETAAENAESLFHFQALAFDGSGDLWVGCEADQGPNLLEFPPSSLAAGGSGLPSVSLTLGYSPGVSLGFDPIPTGLPINP